MGTRVSLSPYTHSCSDLKADLVLTIQQTCDSLSADHSDRGCRTDWASTQCLQPDYIRSQLTISRVQLIDTFRHT